MAKVTNKDKENLEQVDDAIEGLDQNKQVDDIVEGTDQVDQLVENTKVENATSITPIIKARVLPSSKLNSRYRAGIMFTQEWSEVSVNNLGLLMIKADKMLEIKEE